MNSNLQNKLQQFRATPPEGAWNEIVQALDAETPSGRRLHNYEEMPSATNWQRIEDALQNSVPAKVVPFTRRFRKPMRYIAVACFIAVVLVTITLTVRRTEAGALEPTGRTTSNTIVSPANRSTSPSHLPTQPATNTTTETQSGAGPQHAKGTSPGTANSPTATSETAGVNYASLNEYEFFSDDDGNVRRISKKMAGFIHCKDGDSGCKQRLQFLRQKLATKAITTDFTGILDMLQQLQQKP